MFCCFKTEVNGLKWVIYAGPSTSVSPGNDPVLVSYAELLSQVCILCVGICVYYVSYAWTN